MTSFDTRFTRLIGCALPFQSAGMATASTPALAAAVAGAGGLGMLGFPHHSSASPTASDEDRSGAIGVNFLAPFLDLGALDAAAADPAIRVVEVFYGDPDGSVVERIHRGGALASWQVGSVDEALLAADAGCDLVVVQGTEAGGHVRGGLSLLPLLAGALDALAGAAPDLPVVAAGGIATSRAVAACLAAGADAVRCGTVLVATEEADVHPAYAAALVAADGSETVLTTTFGNGWPHAPHRVLRSADDRAMAGEGARSPMFPSRSTDTALVPSMALYAGEGVGAVRAVRPAGEVVTELMTGAAALLDRRH